MAANADVDGPTRTVSPECVSWMRNRLTLTGYQKDHWVEAQDELARKFIASETEIACIAWYDPEGKLLLDTRVPPNPPNQIAYYVKDPSVEINMRNISTAMQFGVVQGNVMDSFATLMSSVFIPMCRANGTWPSSIKKDFTESLHKFLAHLVEVANSIQGRTVLYIPDEDVDDAEAAAKEKDLVQRLDYILIQWTRQIKEVVSNQDNNVELGEDA